MLTNIESQNSKLKRITTFFFLLGLFLLTNLTATAQCAMCRAALGGEQNIAQAEAVNDGIVYLMVIPYLLVAGLAFLIYRMRKNKKGA